MSTHCRRAISGVEDGFSSMRQSRRPLKIRKTSSSNVIALLVLCLASIVPNFRLSLALTPYSSFVNEYHRGQQRTRNGQSTAFVAAAGYRERLHHKRLIFQTKAKSDDSNEADLSQNGAVETMANDNESENSVEYLKDKLAMFSEMALPYF